MWPVSAPLSPPPVGPCAAQDRPWSWLETCCSFTESPILLSTAAQQDRPVNRGWYMNHSGGSRNGLDRGSSLFSHIGARCHDLEASTHRLAGIVSRVDFAPAARR